jgi:hypothetical protein
LARRSGVFATLGLALLTSCGGHVVDRPTSARDLVGYAQRGCGPADGPAVEIYLTDVLPPGSDADAWLDSAALARRIDAAPDPSGDVGTPLLRVLVWRALAQLAGQEFSLTEDQPGWGDVTWCAQDGCVPVLGGRLRFTSAGSETIRGEYELRAPGGGVLAGAFRAAVVERRFPLFCG